jgi:hypothetical protein
MRIKKIKYHRDLIKAKSGDLIVRIYKSGRTAIGVYNCYNFPGIVYLGLTFNEDGGMYQFEKYVIGEEANYAYRLPTLKEIVEIKNLMSKSKDYNHQTYLNYISKYVNNIRKQKVEKLIEINQ